MTMTAIAATLTGEYMLDPHTVGSLRGAPSRTRRALRQPSAGCADPANVSGWHSDFNSNVLSRTTYRDRVTLEESLITQEPPATLNPTSLRAVVRDAPTRGGIER